MGTRTDSRVLPTVRLRTGRQSAEPKAWVGYAFIAPNFLGLATFTFFPMLFTLFVAFTDWNVVSGITGARWVGLENFRRIILDGNFWQSAGLSLVYVGTSVPLTVALGLAIALALNGPVLGRTFLRLIFFIPFIANMVAVAATWILLYHPTYGPINAALRALGVEHPPLWLASSRWAMPALIVMTVWAGAGYTALIYQAALQDIPADLYEAADIDGAGPWARFRSITLPMLSPVSFLLVMTQIIGTSQTFGLINLMTQGGPGRSTTVLSYYIYQNAFQFYQFGYAAAMSLVMFLSVLALTLLMWRLQRRLVFYG